MNTISVFCQAPFVTRLKVVSESHFFPPKTLASLPEALERSFSGHISYWDQCSEKIKSLFVYVSLFDDSDVYFSFEYVMYTPDSQAHKEGIFETLRLDFSLGSLLFGELLTAVKEPCKLVDPVSGKAYQDYKVVYEVKRRSSWGMFDFIDQLPSSIGDAMFGFMEAVCSCFLRNS